jgi:hypothetical protein
VIPVPAAVVANGRPDLFRNVVDPPAEILDAHRLQCRMLLERGIQIGNVRLMMLAVMDLHRLRIDVRFESSEVVWKLGKFVRHESSSTVA